MINNLIDVHVAIKGSVILGVTDIVLLATISFLISSEIFILFGLMMGLTVFQRLSIEF